MRIRVASHIVLRAMYYQAGVDYGSSLFLARTGIGNNDRPRRLPAGPSLRFFLKPLLSLVRRAGPRSGAERGGASGVAPSPVHGADGTTCLSANHRANAANRRGAGRAAARTE